MNGLGSEFGRVLIAHLKRKMREHRSRFGSLYPLDTDIFNRKDLSGNARGKQTR